MLSLALITVAHAAELEMVRSFSGREHARVLLVADVPLAPPELRRERDGEGMSALLRLPGLTLDEQIASSYARLGSAVTIQPGSGMVRQIQLAAGLEVRVQLDLWCEARVIPVGESALLLDFRVPGAPEDPTLPAPTLLADWLDGVSLTRQAAQAPRTRPLVVIDPGHGGDEQGAVGLSGSEEADIALAISLRVARKLEQELDVDVVLTREDDVYVPLQERAALANSLDATLFISIHANAAPAPTAWGIETYTLDSASDAGAARVAARENALLREQDTSMDRIVAQLTVDGTSALSRDLAGRVQTEVVRSLRAVYGEEQIRDLGVKTALFYVLVGTRMPAILFESGFVTMADDELRLRSVVYQEVTAEAITRAVGAWLAAQEPQR